MKEENPHFDTTENNVETGVKGDIANIRLTARKFKDKRETVTENTTWMVAHYPCLNRLPVTGDGAAFVGNEIAIFIANLYALNDGQLS